MELYLVADIVFKQILTLYSVSWPVFHSDLHQ